MVEYRPRLIDSVLEAVLQDVPAVMVVGPRAAGKTTTARRLAAGVLRLDEPATAAVVAADPDAALRRASEPVLIDEWQEVPAVLAAVKRAVDDDPRPGRFILAGSVEADLASVTWPGTGRIVRAVMHGLTRREIEGSASAGGLLPVLVAGNLDGVRLPPEVPDLDGYVRMAATGSLPEPALRLSSRTREPWWDSYVDHVVLRDLAGTGRQRDPVRLRRYLEAVALSTAGQPSDVTLYAAAGIDRRTAETYDRLLTATFLLDMVPAWTSSRITRMVKRAKRYLTDPALAMASARVDVGAVLADPDLLGRILDTFVLAQLRPEVEVLHRRTRIHHLRTEAGRQEVDLVLDLGAGRVVGIEIKAGAAPTRRDARHLLQLRDDLGDTFVRGVVFHTGPAPFELDDRIWALPVAALWG